MNQTQLTTTAASIAAFIAGILSTKLPIFDQATWLAIVTACITIGGAVIGYLTRNTALADVVGKMDGTKVITTAAIANALPNNESVIASNTVKVEEIKK